MIPYFLVAIILPNLFWLYFFLQVYLRYIVLFTGSFGRIYIGTLISAESGEEFKVTVKTVTGKLSIKLSQV